jgi:hypothetical protein
MIRYSLDNVIKRDIMRLSTSLSIVLAGTLLFTGCQSSGNNNTEEEVTLDGSTDLNTKVSKSIQGRAVDGYLVYSTVCLDLNLDNYCQIDDEPASSTDESGTFNLKVTPKQEKHVNFGVAPLLVYDGYDSDTKKDFIGKLKALYDEENDATFNVTPVTTLVEAIVAKEKNHSKDAIKKAKKNVAKALNIDVDLIDEDPVEAAKNKGVKGEQLLKAALKVQKTVELLSNAEHEGQGSENSREKLAEISERIFNTIANGVQDVAENPDTREDASDLLTQILENSVVRGDLNGTAGDVVEAAKVLGEQIETVFEENNNSSLTLRTLHQLKFLKSDLIGTN